jgi:hypothetical protein
MEKLEPVEIILKMGWGGWIRENLGGGEFN